jgi:NB-ARC domain
MQQENRDNATGFQTTVEGGTAYIGTNYIYQSSRPPRGIPFQALALPKDYVDRPEIRQQIKSKLIDCSASRSGTLVVSAIYGLGGVGKSVMAAALAHDREVQEVCKDGVLWVTLGQNPDLLPSLYGWVQALGDYDFNPTTIDSASSHLRSLLRDKKMLLVVDDAWQTDHVAPFQVGGEGCRVLVTTREAQVPDADRIDMDVMSEAESLELLLSKAGVKSLTVEDAEKARKLVGVVGGLPLAVDLAGAQIADGVRWGELLEDLAAEIAYLEALDLPNAEGVRDERTRKRLSLKASLNLSLKILTAEQRQQFAWLGVLPEDVAIQPEMVTTLWSIPLRQARAILRTFRAKALLLSGVEGLGQESSYRIHDLMHDLARGLLTSKGEKDIPGLDLQWQDAHGILLDRYRLQAKDNLWHTLPDDGYIYSYLIWHMEEAGRLNELHGLFQEVTPEGRNGWYERCDFLGQNSKFVTDLGRAWKLAEEMYEENASQSIPSFLSKAIGLQIRYALIFSTLNSLASNIPVELMVALLKNGRWSPSQCLFYAKRLRESSKSVEIIEKLGSFLPINLLSDALGIVRGIRSEFGRIHALNGLLPYLPINLLSEALDIVRVIQSNSSIEIYFLISLSDYSYLYLSKNLVLEVLYLFHRTKFQNHRAMATMMIFIWLVTRLFKNFFSKLQDFFCGIHDGYSHSSLLAKSTVHLPNNLLIESLAVVHDIQDESERTEALSRLAPYLPINLLSEALDIARIYKNKYCKNDALSVLAPYLPINLLLEALDIARGIHDENYQSSTLAKLTTHVPEFMSEALDILHSVQDESEQIKVISDLVPYLSENFFLEVLEVVRNIQNKSERAKALNWLSPHFPKIVLEALDIVRNIQDEYERTNVLITLAPNLPINLLSEVLNIVRGMKHDNFRAEALSGLAPHLPINLLPDALDIARNIYYEYFRGVALRELAPYLPIYLLSEALDIVRGIQNEYCRDVALKELAPYLLEDLLPEALNIVDGIQDESEQINILSMLVPYLSNNLMHKALDIAINIRDEYYRANVLSMLAPYLSGNLLHKALDIAHDIKCKNERAYALIGLAPYLLENLLPEVLNIVRDIKCKHEKVHALIKLAPSLSGTLLHEALNIVSDIQDESKQVDALIKLAPSLSGTLLHEALNIVSDIQDENYRVDVLIKLLPFLSENLWSDALDIALSIRDDDCRDIGLRGLVSHIDMKFCNFSFWSELLHTLAHRDRKHLLEDIPKLAPAIIHLSDRSTLNLVVQAMREVCQQWP